MRACLVGFGTGTNGGTAAIRRGLRPTLYGIGGHRQIHRLRGRARKERVDGEATSLRRVPRMVASNRTGRGSNSTRKRCENRRRQIQGTVEVVESYSTR